MTHRKETCLDPDCLDDIGTDEDLSDLATSIDNLTHALSYAQADGTEL